MLVNLARLVFSQSCSVLTSVCEPQIANHRIDVVLELGHLAAGVDLDRTGQIALVTGGRHFGNRAHLGTSDWPRAG